MMTYYTYTYFIDGVPAYVGKGKGHRFLDHTTRNTRSEWIHHLKKSMSLKRDVRIELTVAESEQSAIDKEVELIAKIGRKDLSLGPLYNLTDGGEGASGCKRPPETIERMKKAQKGRTFSPESLAKMSATCMGRAITEETKAKTSAARKGVPKPVLTCPHCQRTGGANGITRYHFDNCKHITKKGP